MSVLITSPAVIRVMFNSNDQLLQCYCLHTVRWPLASSRFQKGKGTGLCPVVVFVSPGLPGKKDPCRICDVAHSSL